MRSPGDDPPLLNVNSVVHFTGEGGMFPLTFFSLNPCPPCLFFSSASRAGVFLWVEDQSDVSSVSLPWALFNFETLRNVKCISFLWQLMMSAVGLAWTHVHTHPDTHTHTVHIQIQGIRMQQIKIICAVAVKGRISEQAMFYPLSFMHHMLLS